MRIAEFTPCFLFRGLSIAMASPGTKPDGVERAILRVVGAQLSGQRPPKSAQYFQSLRRLQAADNACR